MTTRKCARPDCLNLLGRESWTTQFCSKGCKRFGRYKLDEVISTDDPVRYINERAALLGICWVSFGYRAAGTVNWWYYPAKIAQIPLVALPPLPADAVYRILPFDHKIIYDRGQEWSMRVIPTEYCPKTSGRRKMGA